MFKNDLYSESDCVTTVLSNESEIMTSITDIAVEGLEIEDRVRLKFGMRL